jgi:hypothetical protein
VIFILSSRCEVKLILVRGALSVGMNGEWHSEVLQIWVRLFSHVYSRKLSHVAFIGVETYDFVLPTHRNVQPENRPVENYTIIL